MLTRMWYYFTKYTNIRSLCYASETNLMLAINYISIKYLHDLNNMIDSKN